MELSPMPPYFIIKIGKEEQKRKKEYLTQHILSNPASVAMQREVQFGEIVKIGEAANEWMPMAEIGDYLLVHHFISGKKSDKGYNFYLVKEDDDFNYYAVNGFEIPGERPMAYAVAKGEEIIPTPDYIFLEVPKEENEDLANIAVSESGLIVQKEKTKTRQEWTEVMQKNKKRCQQLANVIPSSPMEEILVLQSPERKERLDFAIAEIKMLEAENLRISQDINKKKYVPFVVAAINPDWNEYIESIYGEKINVGDTVHFLNIATNYILDFNGTNFIVADVKYFGCADSYIRKAIDNGTASNNSTLKKRAGKIRN